MFFMTMYVVISRRAIASRSDIVHESDRTVRARRRVEFMSNVCCCMNRVKNPDAQDALLSRLERTYV